MGAKKIKVSKFFSMELKNFSENSLNKYKKNISIESFVIGILIGENFTEWSLLVCPYGAGENDKKFLGLYLMYRDSDSIKFTTNFRLGITSSIAKDNYSYAEIERSGKQLNESKGRGYSDFISHADLLNKRKDLVIDGKVTFFCDLTISALENDTKVSRIPSNTFIKQFKRMFDNELLSDFEIKTRDGKGLKAHKAILAARSPMVYQMLENDVKELRGNFAYVPDFDYVVMKEVLRFVYYNEVENLHIVAHDLIYAADKYQLKDLKDLCLVPIISSLAIDNAVKSLLIADRVIGTKNLFEECVNSIMSNFDVISKSSEWKDLPSNITTKVIQTMRITYQQDKIVISCKSL